MARDKRRARSITQAQKQRQQTKAAAPSPPASVPAPAPAKAAPGNLERKVTVRLDADRYAELEAYARREGFTVSLVVRHLLCRFLEEQQRFPSARGLLR